jgi:hypothetical protein
MQAPALNAQAIPEEKFAIETRAGEWLLSGPAALFPNDLVGSTAVRWSTYRNGSIGLTSAPERTGSFRPTLVI